MTEPMDNFKVHVCAHYRQSLDKTIELLLGDKDYVVAWYQDGDWLHLLWHCNFGDKVNQFPIKLNAESVKPIVWDWLKQNPPTDKEPDIDGHCSSGFEIVSGDGTYRLTHTLFKVRSIWATHGK